MAVSYKKLSQMLEIKGITWIQLQKEAGYSGNISTRLRADEYVSLESIEKICKTLKCSADKIMEFVEE